MFKPAYLTACAALFVLTACSGTEQHQDPSAEPESTNREIPPGDEDVNYFDASWSHGDPLPSSRIDDWVAKEPLPAPQYTPEERLDYHTLNLTDFQHEESVDVAELDIATLIPPDRERPFTEAWSAIAQCVTDQGFPAQPNPFGGFTFTDGVSASQGIAFDRVFVDCYLQSPPDPTTDQVMSDYSDAELASIYYDYWVEALIPCLESVGGPPAHDVPTKEAYLDYVVGTRPLDTQEAAHHDLASWNPAHWSGGRALVDAACPPYPGPDQIFR